MRFCPRRLKNFMHTVFINANFWISKVIRDWLWQCCSRYCRVQEQPSGACCTGRRAEFANAPTLVIHSNKMPITVWEVTGFFMLYRASLKKTFIIKNDQYWYCAFRMMFHWMDIKSIWYRSPPLRLWLQQKRNFDKLRLMRYLRCLRAWVGNWVQRSKHIIGKKPF